MKLVQFTVYKCHKATNFEPLCFRNSVACSFYEVYSHDSHFEHFALMILIRAGSHGANHARWAKPNFTQYLLFTFYGLELFTWCFSN